MVNQVKWFDRQFNFHSDQNIFPSIIERLSGTPIRLKEKIRHIPQKILKATPDNKWSILENIGHLLDLEPLWFGRLNDILHNKKELRPADLSNRKTHTANHNDRDPEELVSEFSKERNKAISKLETLTEEDIFKSALHPRLKTPMRTMDLFLFVAEHDDHHLARITELYKLLSV